MLQANYLYIPLFIARAKGYMNVGKKEKGKITVCYFAEKKIKPVTCDIMSMALICTNMQFVSIQHCFVLTH